MEWCPWPLATNMCHPRLSSSCHWATFLSLHFIVFCFVLDDPLVVSNITFDYSMSFDMIQLHFAQIVAKTCHAVLVPLLSCRPISSHRVSCATILSQISPFVVARSVALLQKHNRGETGRFAPRSRRGWSQFRHFSAMRSYVTLGATNALTSWFYLSMPCPNDCRA